MKNILVLLAVSLAVAAHSTAVGAELEKPGSAGLQSLLPRLADGQCYSLASARDEFAKNPVSCASYGEFLFAAYPQLLDHATGNNLGEKFLSLFGQSEAKRVAEAKSPIVGYNSGLLNGEIAPAKEDPESLPPTTKVGKEMLVAVHAATGIIWLKLDCGNLFGSETTWEGKDAGLKENPWSPPPPPASAPEPMIIVRQASPVSCPTDCPTGPTGATGPQGPKGDTGPQGPKGEAAVFPYRVLCWDGREMGKTTDPDQAALLLRACYGPRS